MRGTHSRPASLINTESEKHKASLKLTELPSTKGHSLGKEAETQAPCLSWLHGKALQTVKGQTDAQTEHFVLL